MNRTCLVAAWVLSEFLFAAGAANAATRFVSNTGQNNPAAGSEEHPWATLQYAAGHVAPGDTVMVQDGNYAPFIVTKPGAKGRPIVFKSVHRGGAHIQSSISESGRRAAIHILSDYVVVDGFRVTPTGGTGINERGIRVSGAPDDTRYGNIVRNCIVRNAGWNGITTSFAQDVVIEYNDVAGTREQHGIYVANSADNPIVRGNIIHDTKMAGLHMNGDASTGGDGEISGALVESNIIFNTGGGSAAINMDGVTHSIVRNNLLYNNAAQGITNFREDGSSASYDNKILNNTIVMPPGSSHALRFKHGSSGAYVRNNILIQLGSADSIGVDAQSLIGLDSDYNIVTRFEDTAGDTISLAEWRQRHPHLDAHSFIEVPTKLFINPSNDAKADYRLLPMARAVDAGATLPGDVNVDILGIGRPQGAAYDIGAYELPKKSAPIAH